MSFVIVWSQLAGVSYMTMVSRAKSSALVLLASECVCARLSVDWFLVSGRMR